MLSNTATPKYYGRFRDAVIRGEIPVCNEISMEMNRVDALIANPNYYYDDLDNHIIHNDYDVRCFGYDPYNAKEFVERWAN